MKSPMITMPLTLSRLFKKSLTYTCLANFSFPLMSGTCLLTSLFTNIPLEECSDLAVSYISERNPDVKLTPSDLKRLFSFATAETHFLFEGSFYD